VRTNMKPIPIRTHEGGVASRINPEQMLRRSVMACMLWEDTFYEDGTSIATRIAELIPQVDPDVVSKLAVMARTEMNLRHAPLWLAVGMARHGMLKAQVLADTIRRADELAEFLSLYWSGGKCSLSAQVKKGLALAFPKFDAYQLAKYDRANAVKLRDVLFLCHAKPKDAEQAATWKALIDGTLPSPDTWEVAQSAGGAKKSALEKKENWERLLTENRLGSLALLRNLRNMCESGVDQGLIKHALLAMDTSKVLPFRFIAAARHAPQLESHIEVPFMASLERLPKLSGRTAVLVDVSGSMVCPLSAKSDMHRIDAACGIAMCLREMCGDVDVFSFSEKTMRVANRHGIALRDAIVTSQPHSCTFMGDAVRGVIGKSQTDPYDRMIVVTDEQAHDDVGGPQGRGYIINVASYKNGVNYGQWLHIDGFSEAVVKYLVEYERQFACGN